jgi:predicted metal-dependent phosphoesterase TrpH
MGNNQDKNKNKSDVSSVDMHAHSIRSLDGGLAISKLLKHAKANNVKHLSITDHNNLEGIKKALRLVESKEEYKDLNLIPGIEITCHDEELGAKFHMLVYDFDVENKALNDKFNKIKEQEKAQYYSLFAVLEQNFGFKFSPYQITKAAATNPEINWDVVAEMAVLNVDENGKPAPYAKTKEEFLTKIKSLIEDHKAHAKNKQQLKIDIDHFTAEDIEKTNYVSLKEILPIIIQAGGIPVLAHPEHMTFKRRENNGGHKTLDQKREDVIKAFKQKTSQYGLKAGMEVFFPAGYKREGHYLNLAKRYNLIVSGGSDFHGPHKSKNHRLGTISNYYKITKLPIIDYIESNRDATKLYYPKTAGACMNTVSRRYKSQYANLNHSMLSNKKLKKASELNKVLTQFGDKPMKIYSGDEKLFKIRHRNNFVIAEKRFRKLIEDNRYLIDESNESENNCLKNTNMIHDNDTKLKNMLEDYKYEVNRLQPDGVENFDKFSDYAKQTFQTMVRVYANIDLEKQDLYNKYSLNNNDESKKSEPFIYLNSQNLEPEF